MIPDLVRSGGSVVRPLLSLVLGVLLIAPASGSAQQSGRVVELTLDRMVELGLRDSYRVQQLQLGVEQRRSILRAEQADLKSRVDLRIATPEFRAISDEKWNPDLGRNEIVHTNTRLWQTELSVRQPVILFGFPTNGVLSLNNRVYRYSQLDDENGDEVRYYNRYYVAYEQPLFQPNRMRNELEEARLDLEAAELDYMSDVVGVVGDLAGDYFDLVQAAYRQEVEADRVADLEAAVAAAAALSAADTTREIEVEQLQVELANAREAVQQARSEVRLQAAGIKQRLRLNPADSLVPVTDLQLEPVHVDLYQAIHLATALAPRMRELEISRRRGVIDLEQTRGRNSFRMDVELSYGREMQDPRLQELWGEPRNSYTVRVNGYMPLWDWGARRHRIQAEQYSLERTELRAEEARAQIEVAVESQIRNLEEYESRALNMQENLALARQLTESTMARYRAGAVTLVDVLQTIDREAATAKNFMQSYIGYRDALLRLQRITHFDFRTGHPVLQRFGGTDVPPEAEPAAERPSSDTHLWPDAPRGQPPER